MEYLLLVVTVLLYCWPLHHESDSRWIIWDVGQGEWVTYETEEFCLHFDMGGEKFPGEPLRAACGDKENLVYFSHWDLDHVGFARRARRILPRLCLGQAPLGRSTARKAELLKGLPACVPRPDVLIWQPPTPARKRSVNESSQIYFTHGMLVTGDAPKKEERLFVLSKLQPRLSAVHWLVLGHHGSRTSTSEILLRALPELRLTVASSRHAKYGHPHSEIERRVQDHHLPLLTTEDWGHIVIENREPGGP